MALVKIAVERIQRAAKVLADLPANQKTAIDKAIELSSTRIDGAVATLSEQVSARIDELAPPTEEEAVAAERRRKLAAALAFTRKQQADAEAARAAEAEAARLAAEETARVAAEQAAVEAEAARLAAESQLPPVVLTPVVSTETVTEQTVPEVALVPEVDPTTLAVDVAAVEPAGLVEPPMTDAEFEAELAKMSDAELQQWLLENE